MSAQENNTSVIQEALYSLKSFIKAELFMVVLYTISFKHLLTTIILPAKIKK